MAKLSWHTVPGRRIHGCNAISEPNVLRGPWPCLSSVRRFNREILPSHWSLSLTIVPPSVTLLLRLECGPLSAVTKPVSLLQAPSWHGGTLQCSSVWPNFWVLSSILLKSVVFSWEQTPLQTLLVKMRASNGWWKPNSTLIGFSQKCDCDCVAVGSNLTVMQWSWVYYPAAQRPPGGAQGLRIRNSAAGTTTAWRAAHRRNSYSVFRPIQDTYIGVLLESQD